MNCPACGNSNAADADICILCGQPLSEAGRQQLEKDSHAARVDSGIRAVLILMLLLSVALFIAAVLIWRIDAPPIPNDFTIADIRSAPANCQESFYLLASLSEVEEEPNRAPAIGLTAADVDALDHFWEIHKEGGYSQVCESLRANAGAIEQAWENAAKGRAVIEKLDSYEEIADLGEPDLEADTGYLSDFKHIVRLYGAWACVQTEQGNSEQAVRELVKIDSVVRKWSVNARSLVSRLVCFGSLGIDFRAANFVSNHPMASMASLRMLSQHFSPLTEEAVSLRNSITFEYLMFKDALDKVRDQAGDRKLVTLKDNSILRLYRNTCGELIGDNERDNVFAGDRLDVWPTVCPQFPVKVDAEGRTSLLYTIYNPVGALVVQILLPAYEKVLMMPKRVAIDQCMMHISLDKRFGRQVNLKAVAYGDQYILDMEKGKIISVGADEEPYTDDDLSLPINIDFLETVV